MRAVRTDPQARGGVVVTSPLPTDEDARRELEYMLAAHRVGPDRANVRNAADVALAEKIIVSFRRSVVSTPSDEVRALIEEALVTLKSPYPGSTVREGSRVGPYDFQRANEETRRILRAALEASAVSAPPEVQALIESLGALNDDYAMNTLGRREPLIDEAIRVLSAVSAPPTITDEALQRLREAVFAQSQRERSTGARGSGLYYPSIDAATTILRAALGGEEQQ